MSESASKQQSQQAVNSDRPALPLPYVLPIGSKVNFRIVGDLYPLNASNRKDCWKKGLILSYEESGMYRLAELLHEGDPDYSFTSKLPKKYRGVKCVWVGYDQPTSKLDFEWGGKLKPTLKFCVPYTADWIIPRSHRPTEQKAVIVKPKRRHSDDRKNYSTKRREHGDKHQGDNGKEASR